MAKKGTSKGTSAASYFRKGNLEAGYPLREKDGKTRIVTKPPIGKQRKTRQQKDREEQENVLRDE